MFEEALPSAAFNRHMRELLLECCAFDWSAISPAIFGAMFQTVMDPLKRTTLGEQYTPQYIIKKVLKPLMIDELYEDFSACERSFSKLEAFHNRIVNMKFLDPACGCGNFLVVAYAMLRHLELEVLRCQYPKNDDLPADFDLDKLIKVNVGQFYGIDIEEFPCQIAQAGMWLIDHKMNIEAANTFGRPFIRIPLTECAHIYNKNALTVNWDDLIPRNQISHIMGNPPFYGAKKLTDSQRTEINGIFAPYRNSGLLDYVAAWYMCAAKYMHGTTIKAAFVSTNSITQGEQVAALWQPLMEEWRVVLSFGYRPFRWTNEARDMATVHCVIIGFQTYQDDCTKTIYNEDESPIEVAMINPYLDGLPEVTFIKRRNTPICNVPEIGIGNKPIDNGNYLFTRDEADVFIEKEPQSKKWFRKWYGSREFINKKPRYCLWLGDCPPNELIRMPHALERVNAVKKFRQDSLSAPTRAIASVPRRFHVENFPQSRFLLIPEVSSEHREYIPMGFMEPDVLCSNLVKILPHATIYHFGVLTSSIHMIWTRAVCGRLEERYRYSIEVVYSNFPWPNPTAKQKQQIEVCALNILDVREKYSNCTYRELYNSDTMPLELFEAHKKLDKAVKAAYVLNANASDKDCIIELFRLYRALTEHENHN